MEKLKKEKRLEILLDRATERVLDTLAGEKQKSRAEVIRQLIAAAGNSQPGQPTGAAK